MGCCPGSRTDGRMDGHTLIHFQLYIVEGFLLLHTALNPKVTKIWVWWNILIDHASLSVYVGLHIAVLHEEKWLITIMINDAFHPECPWFLIIKLPINDKTKTEKVLSCIYYHWFKVLAYALLSLRRDSEGKHCTASTESWEPDLQNKKTLQSCVRQRRALTFSIFSYIRKHVHSVHCCVELSSDLLSPEISFWDDHHPNPQCSPKSDQACWCHCSCPLKLTHVSMMRIISVDWQAKNSSIKESTVALCGTRQGNLLKNKRKLDSLLVAWSLDSMTLTCWRRLNRTGSHFFM